MYDITAAQYLEQHTPVWNGETEHEFISNYNSTTSGYKTPNAGLCLPYFYKQVRQLDITLVKDIKFFYILDKILTRENLKIDDVSSLSMENIENNWLSDFIRHKVFRHYVELGTYTNNINEDIVAKTLWKRYKNSHFNIEPGKNLYSIYIIHVLASMNVNCWKLIGVRNSMWCSGLKDLYPQHATVLDTISEIYSCSAVGLDIKVGTEDFLRILSMHDIISSELPEL